MSWDIKVDRKEGKEVKPHQMNATMLQLQFCRVRKCLGMVKSESVWLLKTVLSFKISKNESLFDF